MFFLNLLLHHYCSKVHPDRFEHGQPKVRLVPRHKLIDDCPLLNRLTHQVLQMRILLA